MDTNDLWLIGSGGMAQDYARVLAAMERNFTVIGRGAARAELFREATGHDVLQGGLEAALAANPAPRAAIIATGVDTLAALTQQLLAAGTRAILVEKPAGLSIGEVHAVAENAANRDADVFVAYNRRFYASVEKAREIIAADGGLLSMTFDFTEIAEKVGRSDKLAVIKERWLLANSTHVLDLAFYLGGAPLNWSAFRRGKLDWHLSAALFSGAGVTQAGVLFSYSANWIGPGRWGIELITSKRRLILRPMENLAVQNVPIGGLEHIKLNDTLDKSFKPGLYQQTAAFLSGSTTGLCKIEEHLQMMEVYVKIGGYI